MVLSFQELGQHRIEVTPLHAEHVMCSGDIGRPPQVMSDSPWSVLMLILYVYCGNVMPLLPLCTSCHQVIQSTLFL